MTYPDDEEIGIGVIDPVKDRVEAMFEANHTYQFTFARPFHVTLWDDTAGKHVDVAHWIFGPSDFQGDKIIPSVLR